VCLQHFADIGSGSVSPTREQLALPADAFVFACFNSLYKVARHFIRLRGTLYGCEARYKAARQGMAPCCCAHSPVSLGHQANALMLRLAAPAVRIRLAGSAGVVRCRMLLLLLLRPRWPLPGEPVHLRRVGAHHAAGAAKAHGCPQLRSPAGARRFVLRTRPCLPRRGGARAMRIRCSVSRTVRLDSRAGSVRRPLAAGDAQAGRQVPLTRAL
jgi:hypothetical protein